MMRFMLTAAKTVADDGGVRVATTRLDEPAEAVAQLFAALGSGLAGVVLFCSSRYDLDQLSAALTPHVARMLVVGCTSSGELTPEGIAEGTITAIGFPREAFALAACCFADLDHFDAAAAQRRVRALVAEAAEGARALGARPHRAALFLVDGLSHREEMLTITLQDALGDIPLIGGSSGDGLAFQETFIFFEGRFRRDAALVAVLSSARPMRVFRAQHHVPGDTKMVITGADPVARVVFEINAEPAANEYARLVGMRRDELGLDVFAAHPPMVRAGGEYYVRSIQSANADGSLTFYCAIDEGVVLTLGQSRDIMAGLRALFDGLEEAVGGIDRVIGFDCVLNSVEVRQRQLTRAVSELFASRGVVGFNTYGEQFQALHVNQTFSGLAIGR